MSDGITDTDVERIAKRVVELICCASSTVKSTLGVDELQARFNCKSLTATYRVIRQLGIRPYSKGKYRAQDVENAMARASYNAGRRKAVTA